MLRHIFPLAFVLSLLAASTQAQTPKADQRTFADPADSAKVLKYCFLEPAKIEEGKKYPLLLCLHGAGERGDDNYAQVGHFSPLFSGEAREKYPCFVILPQVPKGQIWATFGWSAQPGGIKDQPSATMGLTKQLVDETIKKYPIDPQRIYVTGLSMGGYGTWEFISRWPEMVAAASPICGGGDVEQAAKIKSLPIWVFHGDKDGAVKPEESIKMVDALKAAGGEPKFTLYPGVGHGSWGAAFRDPELLKWMFGQQKK